MAKDFPKRLVLIDGHAIIHRAYHAIPILTDRAGRPTNAVYGFVSMLLRVVDDLKPAWLAVCFDLPVPTFRHEAYIAYQAHRPQVDQELKDQIELVKEVLETSGIPIYTAPGYEADDVIGTLAKQATEQKWEVRNGKLDSEVRGEKSHIAHRSAATPASHVSHRTSDIEVVIVTGDKDIMQLVDDKKRIRVYAPVRGLSEAQMFDEKAVEEHVGVAPAQIIDYKALMGDASDNYPGVPGIGPKTAVALLKKYGSLDNVYSAVPHLSRLSDNSAPATGGTSPRDSAPSKRGRRPLGPAQLAPLVIQKLKDGRDGAMLSQKLARIVCDVPVELDLERARIHNLATNDRFSTKLAEFGFRSLLARLAGNKQEEGGPRQTRRKAGSEQMDLLQ